MSQNGAELETSYLLRLARAVGQQNQASASTYDSVSIGSTAAGTEIDDAVSLGVKRLCSTFITCILLWLVSFVIIMMQVIDKGHFASSTSFLFIPMWIGSVYGLLRISLILVCVCKNGATLISKERRLFILAQGLELENYIDFESLPLMRRLFFWSSVLATFLLLALTTQILLFLWIIAGLIGMWHAVIPIIVIFALLQIYLILVKTGSAAVCFCFALSLTSALLYTVKCKNELEVSWMLTVLPIGMVEAALLVHCVYIIFESCRGRMTLTCRQCCCLTGYLLSLIVAVVSEAVTVTRDFPSLPPFHLPLTPDSVQTLPMIGWTVAGAVFVLSVLMTVEQELTRIALSRGYTDPLPLTRSDVGWGPNLGYRETSSMLLGAIKIPPPIEPQPAGRNWPVRGWSSRGRRGTSINSPIGLESAGEDRDSERDVGRARRRGNVEEGEESSVCLDRTGVASFICRNVKHLHRSVSLFVTKTSIVQSVRRRDTDPFSDADPVSAVELCPQYTNSTSRPQTIALSSATSASERLEGEGEEYF